MPAPFPKHVPASSPRLEIVSDCIAAPSKTKSQIINTERIAEMATDILDAILRLPLELQIQIIQERVKKPEAIN